MNNIPPTPKAVLFDWDNTLIDNWPTGLFALNTVFAHYNKPLLTLAELKARPARSLRETFPILFGDEWERAAAIYYTAYRDVHLDLLTPLAGAEELLNYLFQNGLYMGVVSNKLGDNLRIEAAHLGWEKYFKGIVGSKDTAHDKPSPIPVQLALKGSQLDLSPKIWFIGDSDVDMTTARDASLTGIYVNNKNNIAKMQESHPEIISFNNLMEITNFLLSNPTIITPNFASMEFFS